MFTQLVGRLDFAFRVYQTKKQKRFIPSTVSIGHSLDIFQHTGFRPTSVSQHRTASNVLSKGSSKCLLRIDGIFVQIFYPWAKEVPYDSNQISAGQFNLQLWLKEALDDAIYMLATFTVLGGHNKDNFIAKIFSYW